MKSAFGVEHGEIEKGLGDLARTVKLQGQAVKGGFKLQRLHTKKALGEAGYPTKQGAHLKESFKAGMKGTARQYGQGRKQALGVARSRAKRDIGIASRQRGPATFGETMSENLELGGARLRRSLSQ